MLLWEIVLKLLQIENSRKITLIAEQNEAYKQLRQAEGRETSQPTITCSKLTIETLEQGVKYVQSYQ